MARLQLLIAVSLCCQACLHVPADASSLRIAPVSVELAEPARTAALRVRNEGETPITIQMRVFRWTQNDGEDRLEPTRDVVISPPIAELLPQRDYVVRIVRLAARPVVDEENYRVIVDELPGSTGGAGSAVALLIRKSLPVSFTGRTWKKRELTWSAHRRNGRIAVIAKNPGNRRTRISGLTVTDSRNRRLLQQDGLSGYVLGKSARKWILPDASGQPGAGETLHISAETASGRIEGHAILREGG